ncbi:TolC family protein [bacterium]|nr:TolC family protein [bacterium]
MKKKILFISVLSLLTVMPCAFAEPEQALSDTPVAEEAPQLNLDNQTVKKEKKRLFSWIKKAKKQKKQTEETKLPEPDLGEEVDAVSPDNSAQIKGGVSETKIMSVDDCIRFALENNPAIENAMGTSEIYKTKIGQAWSAFFPTFSAGVSYSRNEMFRGTFGGMDIPKSRYNLFYDPQLSANMLVFDFGKTSALAKMAKKTYEATELDVQTTILNVIFNVKSAYYHLLFALQQEKLYEDTVQDFELHLKQAQAYYQIGTKPKIDVLTAEYNLGNAKLNLIKAQNTVKVASAQLSNAMGLPEFTNFTVKDEFKMNAYDVELNNALKTAFETRPALLAAKKKSDASELLVKSSLRAFTPDLSAFASYNRGGKNLDTDQGYQFGGQLSYSGVNLMRLKKQVDEAKATHKRDLAAYEVVKQQVYLEVKEGYLDLVNAQDSIGVARLAMNTAKEQYDQASGRYKVGLGTAIELKDAETTYRNSQLQYYQTVLNYHVSAANLENMIGKPIKSSEEKL